MQAPSKQEVYKATAKVGSVLQEISGHGEE